MSNFFNREEGGSAERKTNGLVLAFAFSSFLLNELYPNRLMDLSSTVSILSRRFK